MDHGGVTMKPEDTYNKLVIAEATDAERLFVAVAATNTDEYVLRLIAEGEFGLPSELATLRLRRLEAFNLFNEARTYRQAVNRFLRLTVLERVLENVYAENYPNVYDEIIDDSFFYFMGADDFAAVYAEPVKTIVYNEKVTKEYFSSNNWETRR